MAVVGIRGNWDSLGLGQSSNGNRHKMGILTGQIQTAFPTIHHKPLQMPGSRCSQLWSLDMSEISFHPSLRVSDVPREGPGLGGQDEESSRQSSGSC